MRHQKETAALTVVNKAKTGHATTTEHVAFQPEKRDSEIQVRNNDSEFSNQITSGSKKRVGTQLKARCHRGDRTENAEFLADSKEDRKREASKPLYLIRYE